MDLPGKHPYVPKLRASGHGSLHADRLVSLFEVIAAKEGWQPGDQLRAHIHRSIYFAATRNGNIVGGIQLEVDDGSGFWSFQYVWPDVKPKNDAVTGHIAVLALIPEVRDDRACSGCRA